MGKKNKYRTKAPPYSRSNRFELPTEEEINWDQHKPIFSLDKLHNDYCISGCIDKEKVAFVDWLFKLTRLTWNQIKLSDRKKLGCEKINNAPKAYMLLSDELKKLKIELIAFHCGDYIPIIGYREDRIFHILFIDRKMKLYKH